MNDTTLDAVTEVRKVGAIKFPDAVALSKSASTMSSLADTLEIESDDDYVNAGKDLQIIKARWKEIEGMRTSITGPQNTALRATNAFFAPFLDRLARAEDAYKRAMLGWDAKVKAENERLRLELEAAAAAERAKAEAEAKRIEQEAAAVRAKQAEEAARLAAMGKADEAAALAAQGDLLAQQAEQDAAAQRQAAALIVAAPPPPAAKAAGIGVASGHGFTVDLADLIKWVAANMAERPECVAYLRPDEVKIRAQVRATGEATRIGGVTVTKTSRMSVR